LTILKEFIGKQIFMGKHTNCPFLLLEINLWWALPYFHSSHPSPFPDEAVPYRIYGLKGKILFPPPQIRHKPDGERVPSSWFEKRFFRGELMVGIKSNGYD